MQNKPQEPVSHQEHHSAQEDQPHTQDQIQENTANIKQRTPLESQNVAQTERMEDVCTRKEANVKNTSFGCTMNDETSDEDPMFSRGESLEGWSTVTRKSKTKMNKRTPVSHLRGEETSSPIPCTSNSNRRNFSRVGRLLEEYDNNSDENTTSTQKQKSSTTSKRTTLSSNSTNSNQAIPHETLTRKSKRTRTWLA